MFYGKGGNTAQQTNINTNFYTSYSDTAVLTAGGWNTQLSIKLKPCIGVDASGIRQYAEDRSQTISTSITPDNAIALLEGFNENVLPAIKGEKEAGSVSIVMGTADQRKILSVGYENGDAYLGIALGLNESGKATNEIRHKFNKRSYLIDYNASVGNAVEKSVETDLYNFIDKVKAVKDLTPVIAHSIKYNDANKAAFTSGGQKPNVSATNSYQAPVIDSNGMDFIPFS